MITVIGSINWDVALRVQALPLPGETVVGSELHTGLGGKGANQAIAAARAGGNVTMIASVGEDEAGRNAVRCLTREGVTLQLQPSSFPTGTAVSDEGQNSIMIYPGANLSLLPEHVTKEKLETSKALLLQLELAKETWQGAIRTASSAGVLVVVNASPLQDATLADFTGADIILVNEIEAGQLLGRSRAKTPAQALEYAQELCKTFPTVVMTLGGDGVVWATEHKRGLVPAHEVEVVDTTGAGDAFAGALTVALVEGKSLEDAVTFANAAAALATFAFGAATSPRREQVLEFLQSRLHHA
jgi:ribokinase